MQQTIDFKSGNLRSNLAALFLGAWVVTAVSSAFADYEKGLQAWEANRYREAISEWIIAANAQDRDAMFALGQAYVQGLGVVQDFVEAHKWFNLAASLGLRQAVDARDNLEAEMTAEERAEARILAKQWQPDKLPEVSEELTSSVDTQPVVEEDPPPEAIREAQSLLLILGYQPGSADGVWGPKSASAFAAFSRDTGLPSSNVLTPGAIFFMRDLVQQYGTDSQLTPSAETSQADGGDESSARNQVSQNAVILSAITGELSTLRTAIDNGENLDEVDQRGWTALMYSVNKRQLPAVKTLVEAGANVNARAPDGATPLFMAVVLGQPQIVEALMQAGADIVLPGPKGRTAVTMAQKIFGTAEEAEAKGFNDAVIGLIEGKTWKTIAAWKAASSEFAAKMGRDPSPSGIDENGLTDLHWAAALNLPKLVKLLLAEGLNIDVKDGIHSRTPLHHAILKEAPAVMILLIAYGANVEAKDSLQYTALHYAAQKNLADVAKLLITQGANIEALDRTNKTPLHDAARRNSPDVAQLLVSQGANLNAKDKLNATPLHYAYPGSPVAEVLTKSGAGFN